MIAIGIGIGLGLRGSSGGRATAVVNRTDLSVLLAAIVDPQGKTMDGDRVTLILPAWNAILDLLANDPDALFKIDPRKMEELIAAKYDAEGFDQVILTPRSRDLGRDVIAVSRTGARVTIFDQVKAYGERHTVSANDVRALMGVLAYSEATKGVVTTTSDFAPLIEQDRYIKNALDAGLELVNGKRLLQRFSELKSK